MRYILLILTLSLFFGCSKVNEESYERIQVGMNYNLVVEILGKPNSCENIDNIKNCVWGNVSKNIKVRFLNERAILKNEIGVL